MTTFDHSAGSPPERLVGTSTPARVTVPPDVPFPESARSQPARPGEEKPKAKLQPSPRNGPVPVSFAQRRLWLLDQLEPGSNAYNMPRALRLKGSLDVAALEKTMREIVRRHESLRTTFELQDDAPVQVVSETPAHVLTIVDLHSLPDGSLEDEMQQRVWDEAQRPFDLQRGPLFRATLFRIAPEDHVLLVNLHHIVSDGWSSALLAKEISTLYGAFSTGSTSPLPELPIQYADFSQWQHEWLRGAEEERQLAFWRTQLGGGVPALELPTDRPRTSEPAPAALVEFFSIPPALVEGLQRVSRTGGCTLYMTMMAAFQALLFRKTGQDDFAVGSVIAGRNHVQIEPLIGFFANTLVIRADLKGSPRFVDLLARVREFALGSFDFQDLPFERLVEELNPPRDLDRTPLFQVTFLFQNLRETGVEFPGLATSPFEVGPGAAKFDLNMVLLEDGPGLRGKVEFNPALFDRSTIQQLAAQYRLVCEQVAADPARPVARLALVDEAERARLIDGLNPRALDFSSDATAVQLFEEQVRRTPDAIALISGNESLTFAELDRRANQLACHLRARGVGRGTLAGLCLDRTPDLITGVLGILKAGGAYVPLDPNYPKARLEIIIEDSRLGVILTETRLAGLVARPGIEIVQVDEPAGRAAIASLPDGALEPLATPRDLAYVIYTSGSTGRPKGVAVEHRNLLAFLHWARATFPDAEIAGTLAATSVCFDLSVFEMFTPLCWGGTIHLAKNVLELPGLPTAGQITLVNTVPSAMAELLAAQALPASVRVVNLAGEPLPASTVDQLYALPHIEKVHDLYGPTEVTVYSTFALREAGTAPTIGRPIAGTRAYLLDRHLQPVPFGDAGEIHLGGACVARGYLHRPDLTAERFLPDPFNSAAGAEARMYRTGDLARYREDGSIEFLGRIDHQVKVRGFRIELEDIQENLRTHAGVADAVVIARDDARGDKQLVAFVVPSAADGSLEETLRAHLAARLPAYMVPQVFVVLDSLPLTPNGKVDRRALPKPGGPAQARGAGTAVVSDSLLQTVAHVWKEILRRGDIGIDSNFFELGGHSLTAMRVVSKLGATLGAKVPLRLLFSHPTIRSLAAAIAATTHAPEGMPASAHEPAAPLPVSRDEMRLWFLHQLKPDGAQYNVHWVVRIRGRFDADRMRAAFASLMQRHTVLRTGFADRDGKPERMIAAACEVPFTMETLPAGDASLLEARLREELLAPFALDHPPLFRVRCIRLSETHHVVACTFHHIISDEWSLGIMSEEIERFHRDSDDSEGAAAPHQRHEYTGYAARQQVFLASAAAERMREFWRARLAGAPLPLTLPTDRPRALGRSARGGRSEFELPAAASSTLARLARAEGATPFISGLAVFALLLRRLSGQDEIVIGTPIANRTERADHHVVGFFLNTLPIRVRMDAASSFRQLLRDLRGEFLETFEHSALPLDEIVTATRVPGAPANPSLFSVMFVHHHGERLAFKLPGALTEALQIDPGAAKMEITLSVRVLDDGTNLCSFEFDRDLFDEARIRSMAADFRALAEACAAEPDAPSAKLSATLQPSITIERRIASDGSGVIATATTTERISDATRAIQDAIAGIWRDVLGVPRVVPESNFFDLGGHSLLAVRAAALLGKKLGRTVPLTLIFDHPTVRALAGSLSTEQNGAPPAVIASATRTADMALSHEERRLWFLHHALPDLSTYNVPWAVRIRGPLDVTRLREAINRLMQRHEILRTAFTARAGTPVRTIAAALDAPFACETIEAGALPQRIDACAREAFDLSAAPLFRVRCFELGVDDHALAITFHHLIVDEWSMGVFLRDLTLAYAGSSAWVAQAGLPPPFQYADYTAWQNERVQSGALAAQRTFWSRQLETPWEPLELPYDRARPEKPAGAGARVRFTLDGDEIARIETIAREESATPFMAWLALYSVFLHRLAGQSDLVIATPLVNRPSPELHELIGFFLNTLPLRLQVEGERSFREILRSVRATAVACMKNGELPLDEIIHSARIRRSPQDPGLFPVMFVLTERPEEKASLPGMTIEAIALEPATAKADLSLFVARTESGRLNLTLECSTDVFAAGTIERLAGQFRTLTTALALAPDAPVGTRAILPDDQRSEVVQAFNQTAGAYPRSASVHELFAQQVAKMPSATALVFEDTRITYRELDARATRLAGHLRALGVKHGQFVAIQLDRSVEFVVTALSILKAGAAYVPLSTDFPEERVRGMLADTGAPVVVTRGNWPASLTRETLTVVDLDRDRAAIDAHPVDAPATACGADDLAYVIYTSGSTGVPKGVAVPHRGIVRLVRGQRYAQFDEEQRVLLLASPAFDASTFEMWGPLLNGGTCVIFPGKWPELEDLKNIIRKERISCMWLTAGLFNQIIDQEPEVLSGQLHVITGGEALSVPHVRRALQRLPDLKLTNGYGPTESTTFACTHEIDRAATFANGSVPIGRPISNTTCYILDAARQPAPIGVAGELYIGGDGLARGYLNANELTAERFVSDPFSADAGERLYRTGDRCRWLADGTIEFLGRLDNQVKIRGFRIELGEIEAALASHPAVAQAAVITVPGVAGTKELAAFVSAKGAAPAVRDLRSSLLQRLPSYMIPSRFVVVGAMPLNANGKVDRRALAALAAREVGEAPEFTAPRNETETALASIWQRLLKRPAIGIHDNFFEAGGHSLLAMRMIHEIESAFSVNVSLAALLGAPTIELLARRLSRPADEPAPKPSTALRGSGPGTPLFNIPGVFGHGLMPPPLIKAIEGDRPFYDSLRLPGADGEEAPLESVEAIAGDLIGQIKAVQPAGPYCLTGFCYGGMLAFEVARRLEDSGDTVQALILWHTFPWDTWRKQSLLTRLIDLPGHLATLPWAERSQFISDRLRGSLRDAAVNTGLKEPQPEAVQEESPIYRANAKANAAYRFRPYSGAIHLIHATQEKRSLAVPPLGGWGPFALGSLTIHEIPCEHIEMIAEPQLTEVSRITAEWLRATEQLQSGDETPSSPARPSAPWQMLNPPRAAGRDRPERAAPATRHGVG